MNPNKIRAIIEMTHLTNKRQVQELTGQIASLSRFISRSAEKSLPFFKTLRRSEGFIWSDECWSAFEALKDYLKNPPLLAKPTEGEPLYLYLSASDEVVGSILMQVGDDDQQKLVYYISRVLHDAEKRCPKMQKLVYSLVILAKRLRPYFQAHLIVVMADQPLNAILRSPNTSGRLAKWVVKLGEFDISFQYRSALKAQVITNFIAECTWKQGTSPRMDEVPKADAIYEVEPAWTLHVDVVSNLAGYGAGLILADPDGESLEYAWHFSFQVSNNQVEYEALLAGLRIANELGIG